MLRRIVCRIVGHQWGRCVYHPFTKMDIWVCRRCLAIKRRPFP